MPSRLRGFRTCSKSKAGTLHLQPVVHLVLDQDLDSKDRDHSTVIAFLRRHGHAIRVFVECKDVDLTKVKAMVLATIRSIECPLPRVPVIPEDQYEIIKQDDVVFCLARGVDKKAMKRVQRTMRVVQRQFEEIHGRVKWPEEEPLQLVLDPRHDAKEKLFALPQNNGIVPPARHLLVRPWEESQSKQEADFAYWLTCELFCEVYCSLEEPAWVARGETVLAQIQVLTGKKPPWVPHGCVDLDLHRRLEDLTTRPQGESSDFDNHALAYVMFFRVGPSKYRKAYKCFLAEWVKSGDYKSALKKHLYALDQDHLLGDARTFLKKKIKRARHE